MDTKPNDMKSETKPVRRIVNFPLGKLKPHPKQAELFPDASEGNRSQI